MSRGPATTGAPGLTLDLRSLRLLLSISFVHSGGREKKGKEEQGGAPWGQRAEANRGRKSDVAVWGFFISRKHHRSERSPLILGLLPRPPTSQWGAAEEDPPRSTPITMDCTAAILKLCARSRSKWSRHKRSPPRPWRRSDGRCCVGGGSGGLDASSLVRRALIYACCCRPGEESSELCPEWEDHQVGGGRGRSVEDGGESELLFLRES